MTAQILDTHLNFATAFGVCFGITTGWYLGKYTVNVIAAIVNATAECLKGGGWGT